MRITASFRVALARLRRRPVRSLLLLQGTVWGVAVALLPPAVIEGTRRAAIERGPEIGADRIAIAADPTAAEARPLVADDVDAVRTAVAAAGIPVTAAAGLYVETAPAEGGRDGTVFVFGPPDGYAARGLVLAEGAPLDPAAREPQVLVEGLLAEDLRAARGRVVGETIAMPDGTPARVVGALAARTPLVRRTNDLGYDVEHPVFRSVTGRLLVALGTPVSLDAWKRTDRCAYAVARSPRVDWIYLRVPADRVRAAARAADGALIDRGKPASLQYPPLYALFLARDVDRFRSVSRALFLACLAMGAVVLTNVGLLAAMRRAAEVAIHRVEGATQGDVAAQFVAESAVLAVVGVALGALAGMGLARLRVALEPTAGFAWVFPWGEAGVAAAVALVFGVLAGTVPAVVAARASPVEALVDE